MCSDGVKRTGELKPGRARVRQCSAIDPRGCELSKPEGGGGGAEHEDAYPACCRRTAGTGAIDYASQGKGGAQEKQCACHLVSCVRLVLEWHRSALVVRSTPSPPSELQHVGGGRTGGVGQR